MSMNMIGEAKSPTRAISPSAAAPAIAPIDVFVPVNVLSVGVGVSAGDAPTVNKSEAPPTALRVDHNEHQICASNSIDIPIKFWALRRG